MRVWLGQHARTLAATVAQLVRTPVASLLNIGVIGVALALPVGFYVVLVNLQQLAGRIATEPQLTLFLAPDAAAEDTKRIEAQLKAHAGVRKFSFGMAERESQVGQVVGLAWT